MFFKDMIIEEKRRGGTKEERRGEERRGEEEKESEREKERPEKRLQTYLNKHFDEWKLIRVKLTHSQGLLITLFF